LLAIWKGGYNGNIRCNNYIDRFYFPFFGSTWNFTYAGLIVLFVIFTNPISSNALARAAHYAGVKLTERSVKDELKEDNLENKGEEK